MSHIPKIVNAILASRIPGNPEIIAICGAADLGKSYLAAEIVKAISTHGDTAAYITLDSFMMNREDRIRKGISGYDPRAYDFTLAASQLEKFKNGQGLSFRAYDHSTGKKVNELTTIKSCEILLLDGLHSLHETLTPYVARSLFVYTNDIYLRKIRREADLVKRKQTVEVSRQIEPEELKKYKQFVEPYMMQANWHLFLAEKWAFSFQENNNMASSP